MTLHLRACRTCRRTANRIWRYQDGIVGLPTPADLLMVTTMRKSGLCPEGAAIWEDALRDNMKRVQ